MLSELLAGLSAVCALYALIDIGDLITLRRRANSKKQRVYRSPTVKLLVKVGSRIKLKLPVGSSAELLNFAGRPLGLSVDELSTVKLGAGAVVLGLGFPFALSMPGRLPYLVLLLLPVAGFYIPDLLLNRAVKRRSFAMESQLPDMLDLLRVAIEAGMSLRRALAEVGSRHSGLLAFELRRAAHQLDLGMTLEDALLELKARCPAPTMPVLITTIMRTTQFGAPLSGYLALQAKEARSTRARLIAQKAAKAAPKIQLVVAMVIVPSVLMIAAAALVANFM